MRQRFLNDGGMIVAIDGSDTEARPVRLCVASDAIRCPVYLTADEARVVADMLRGAADDAEEEAREKRELKDE